jgi:predicted transcriptional regulator
VRSAGSADRCGDRAPALTTVEESGRGQFYRLYYEGRVVDSRRMGEERGSVLGGLERSVMHTVWAARGPVTVRAVLEELNRRRRAPLAYTTVMTVMARLADKEILARRPAGRGYEYEAMVPDEAAIAVRDLMRDFGEAAVSHFVEEARADPRMRRRLTRLLRERP